MKSLGLLLFLFSLVSWAECEFIKCYDPCSHREIDFKGDKCSVTWNKERKCFEAYTECGESKKCLGALCYDYCKEIYFYFKKGNTCGTYYDPAGMCWGATVKCE